MPWNHLFTAVHSKPYEQTGNFWTPHPFKNWQCVITHTAVNQIQRTLACINLPILLSFITVWILKGNVHKCTFWETDPTLLIVFASNASKNQCYKTTAFKKQGWKFNLMLLMFKQHYEAIYLTKKERERVSCGARHSRWGSGSEVKGRCYQNKLLIVYIYYDVMGNQDTWSPDCSGFLL